RRVRGPGPLLLHQPFQPLQPVGQPVQPELFQSLRPDLRRQRRGGPDQLGGLGGIRNRRRITQASSAWAELASPCFWPGCTPRAGTDDSTTKITREGMTMAKYYCILFDADNTLLDFDAAEAKALAETLVHYGIEPDSQTVETYRRINAGLWQQLEKGQIRREKLM